jgi:hypothetical protein
MEKGKESQDDRRDVEVLLAALSRDTLPRLGHASSDQGVLNDLLRPEPVA